MDNTLLVQPATEEQLNALAMEISTLITAIPYYNQLAKQHETNRYNATALVQKIKEDPYSVLLAMHGDAIAGFCTSRFDDYTLWLEWFGVTENYRGKGISQLLLKALEPTAVKRNCHKIWCDSRTSNTAAIHILQDAGYSQITTLRNHWYKQDFILWEKAIEG